MISRRSVLSTVGGALAASVVPAVQPKALDFRDSVTLKNRPFDCGAFYQGTGLALIRVEDNPLPGQYAFRDGSYIFHADDAGHCVTFMFA